MGPTQSANYASTLHFVQNLEDDNFGELEIYRNDDGKFIMKCAKSFLTGDKRHSHFKKIINFIRHTTNKNVLPLLHLEQYHESNVCIEYQKVFAYTEYLNFTLKGLITNRKNIDQHEMWYLVKSMVELMTELENNHLKMVFSLENIFLTLKGIPSVFLYHFMCNQSQSSLNGYPHEKIATQTCLDEGNDTELKPESMSYSLGKTVLQLFNMELIEAKENQTEEEILKHQLFMVNKKNPALGKVIKFLLTAQNPKQILDSIQMMQAHSQISVSSEIRFNKFRYVVQGQEKTEPVTKDGPLKELNGNEKNMKDLRLNDSLLNEFKSRPLSAANTPIYRLRESEAREMGTREVSVRNKTMKPEQSFFKHKKVNQPSQIGVNRGQIEKQQSREMNEQSMRDSRGQGSGEEVKGDPQKRKANSVSGSQGSQVRTGGAGRNSKLSLISKRPLSTTKTESRELAQPSLSQEQTFANGGEFDKANLTEESLQDIQANSSKGLKNSKQSLGNQLETTSNRTTVRAANRIKEILNEELSKSRQLHKTYTNKLNSSLISKHSQTIHPHSKPITYNSKTFKGDNYKPPLFSSTNKTQQNDEEKSIMYKPFMTQHNQPQEQFLIHQEHIQTLFNLTSHKLNLTSHQLNLSKNQNQQQTPANPPSDSKQNPSDSKQSMNSSVCVNGLDKSNFLLSLEMKKSINNLKVKNISHKKDIILSNLNKNLHQNQSQPSYQQTQNDPKTCLRNYFSQKESQASTLKNSTNPTSRVLGLAEISKEEQNRCGFEKKKVKLRSDKNDELQLNQQCGKEMSELGKNKENLKMNKENAPLNSGDKTNSKLRRLSLKAKLHIQ